MALRYIVLSVACMIVMGLLGYWTYMSNLSNVRLDFEHEERKFTDVRRSYNEAKTRLDTLNGEFARAEQRNRELHTKLMSMPGFIDTLESERSALENEWRETILQGRARSVGLSFPALSLNNGVTVTNVRVQKITDRDVFLSHQTGALRLRPNDLPEPLAARFRIDDPVFVGKDPMGAGAGGVDEMPKSAETPIPTAHKLDKTVISDLEARRDRTTANIATLAQARDSWRQKATELRLKHNTARIYGRVSSYAADATAAEGKATELQTEINRMTLQFDQIQKELTDAVLAR